MATKFADIITNFAMHFIDDARWQEELGMNPAQFFRAKSRFLIGAIPRFNRPANIVRYLSDYTDASYADYTYTVEQTVGDSLVIDTGLPGFELCSVGTVEATSTGGVTYTPIQFTYDQSTGEVTIPNPFGAGTVINIDLYTDGEFNNDLDLQQKRIMGLCVAVDWYYKFANNYLNVANLIHDKSFSRNSVSEHIRVNTDRFRMLDGDLSSELNRYEQSLYALQNIPAIKLPKI